jgi:hypothetical protein
MQRFLDYFEQRQVAVDLFIALDGNIFTVTQAKALLNGKEIVAEGVARRSIDAPDPEMAQRISGGRAIKALYLKMKYLKEKREIQVNLEKKEPDDPTRKFLEEKLRLLEKKHKSLIQGHVHLLMG